jgi:formylglycine-generating enzyme required for sulfatase activity
MIALKKIMLRKAFFLFSFLFLGYCNHPLKFQKPEHLPTHLNSVGMEFLEVPAGSFKMGCSLGDHQCEEDEFPEQKMKVESFFLGKYEVTKAQFEIFVKSSNYKTTAEQSNFLDTWKNCFKMNQTSEHPVICVTHADAIAFTQWLSKKERKKYRLPSEVEWEYAARAGSVQKFFWGNDFQDDFAWYDFNADRSTQPVGQKKPNDWGFFDMLGNVREWCNHDYDKNFLNPKLEKKPLMGTKSIRGGSWFDAPVQLRVSTRSYGSSLTRQNSLGFRVLLEK